jgi:hypothetical protein
MQSEHTSLLRVRALPLGRYFLFCNLRRISVQSPVPLETVMSPWD